MNNLFFIWTPFQFFVAQNIIIQEKLENNLLIKGFVGKNKHFYDSYDLMKIDSLWKQCYTLDKLPAYAGIEKKSLLKDIVRLIKYDKNINTIIEKNKIDAIYLGDINNPSCRFTALKYSLKNLKVIFFEEGTAHYYTSRISTRGGTFFNMVISNALDVLFFRSKYHFKYAKFVFDKSLSLKQIPINTRFSILPYYHETYDKQLQISAVFSTNLETYIRNEYEKLKTVSRGREMILFLNQPIDGVNPNATLSLLNTIKKFFSNAAFQEKLIVIKFHPRDTDEKKIQICNLFKELQIDLHILSNEYAIPVEIYLMKIKFNRIVTFYSSTFLYAGYIYPQIPIDFLISNYIEECKKYHIDTTNLEKTVADIFNMINSKQ